MADVNQEFKKFLTDTAMKIRDEFNGCIPDGGMIDLCVYKLDNGLRVRIDMRDRENVCFSYVMGLNDNQFRDETEAMQKIVDNIKKGRVR